MGVCNGRRSTTASYVVMISVVLVTLISAGGALKITELKVPDVIQNGTRASVILDCDYTFEQDSPVGLVIKWFFDGNPTPVYQWILGKTPQGLGVLKNRLNLGYRASTDENKMYRALQILNPSTELTGEYKCVVSTFASEVSQAKTMVVYVPEKSLKMTQVRGENSVVNITCAAEGVFPEPRMTITRGNSAKLQSVHVLTIPHDGVFDISASVLVDDDDSDESNESDDLDDSDGDVDVDGDDPTTFECELEIPDANYTVKKATVFYPGPPTTTVEPDSDELTSDSPDPNLVDANSAPRVGACWTLLLSVVIFLRL